MGHMAGKDIYRQLAQRLDQAPMRTPWTPLFEALIRTLYTPEEASLIIALPYRPATLSRISSLTGLAQDELQRQLHPLCTKGLVIDIWDGSQYRYMVSPLVIGFFEFTMMRVGPELPLQRWAELFEGYMFGGPDFLQANFGADQQVSVMRALPHEEALGERVEILDYERASAIIDEHHVFSLGICSCRHEKQHRGEPCRQPLETCTSMGAGAQFLIRNGLARAIEQQEMRDILARSRDLGLTLSADNVRCEVGFICHCCGCCCNLLRGIRETGYTGILVTASVVAQVDREKCIGCGLCVRACPIAAIHLQQAVRDDNDAQRRTPLAEVGDFCLGCGACALKCPTGALRLWPRPQRVLHPEDSFERVLLQSLERGTLQNLFFDNPASRSHQFMRGLVGGFLRLPLVKQGLMSELVRSRFLSGLRRMAGMQPTEMS